MSTRSVLLATAGLAVLSLSFAGVALARRGADDPAGHVRHSGVDDPATHDVVDDNGVDDPATHDVADDKGADDPATHDVNDDQVTSAAAARASSNRRADDVVPEVQKPEPPRDRQRGRR